MKDISKEEIIKPRKALPGGRAKLSGLFTSFLHQGFFYLDTTERIARMFLEIIPAVLMMYGLSFIYDHTWTNIYLWSTVVVFVHAMNWMINFNSWAAVIFAFPTLRNPGEQATCHYLNEMAKRFRNSRSVTGVMIFGSVARGQWHDRSDLDIRLLRSSGLINAISAVLLLLRERIIAVFFRQPLDIYLADDIGFLMKMRKDEPPIFLVKNDRRLEQAYPGITTSFLLRLRKEEHEKTNAEKLG